MPKKSINGFTQKRRWTAGISFPDEDSKIDFQNVLMNIKLKTREPEYVTVRRLVEEYGVSIGAIKAREREG